MSFLERGKASFVIDGQFGSTGKGLISGYLANKEAPDIAVSCASANAGHTYIGADGKRIVAFHLPISGILSKDSTIYLGAGSIIHPETLWQEIYTYKVDEARVYIHPRAAIITPADVEIEEGSEQMAAIGSTRHGVGQALAAKIRRVGPLAGDTKSLKPLIKAIDLNGDLRAGARVMVEVPQGFDLGINSGLAYPYCTSREISIAQAMSDAQIHPRFLGKVMMTLRTYPIRVAGTSGPFYPDSDEISWEALGVPPEITTVTKKIRRVATFSMNQYLRSLNAIMPDFVFLNFVNYLRGEGTVKAFISRLAAVRTPTHVGTGPVVTDVHPWTREAM